MNEHKKQVKARAIRIKRAKTLKEETEAAEILHKSRYIHFRHGEDFQPRIDRSTLKAIANQLLSHGLPDRYDSKHRLLYCNADVQSLLDYATYAYNAVKTLKSHLLKHELGKYRNDGNFHIIEPKAPKPLPGTVNAKIFNTSHECIAGCSFNEALSMAQRSQYRAMSFNGEIWTRRDLTYQFTKTPFVISDFK